MKNIDSDAHIRGESTYVDDIPELMGSLHAVVVYSTKAHAKIIDIDLKNARQAEGVVDIIVAKDVEGQNQIGGIIADEPLFAEKEVHFIGQPIALIVAETNFMAKEARKLVSIKYEEKEVITDPRIAKARGMLLFPSRCFSNGNAQQGFQESDYVFSGRVDSGAQEHLYIEAQGSYALHTEGNNIKIYSSTQGATIVQTITANVLGIPMNKIEVDVKRLGGAFGGKEDQATAWAVMAALAAKKLKRAIKLILDRDDDLLMTGKRHPYSSDFKIGLDKNYKIKAIEVEYFQNGGAAADLSPAIMERTLFHVANAYFIPNLKATAHSCKTNITPFTAFRGFGAPQAMFVVESAIALAANELGVDKTLIQKKNLINNGDEFHYGQICDSNNAVKSWNKLESSFNLLKTYEDVNRFNSKSKFLKKGISIMPICFGISFTKTPMNQARSLVHIYQDGSVGISSGAIEMGQGVNTKLSQLAARIFSIDISRIKIETTNTTRVANTSPTAASSGADLNGKALQLACQTLKERLIEKAASILNTKIDDIEIRDEQIYSANIKTDIAWTDIVETAFLDRIQLSEIGHYSTPIIHFDKKSEKGHPFAYHVFGTAMTSVLVDCIKGNYSIEDVKIVHDFGNSMNKLIDEGQVEGGLMQGIGWMTCEEIKYSSKGELLADSLSKYKVPDSFMAPKNVEIIHLESEGPELAILKSKAVGEPPLMYGIGSYFAVQHAILSFNKNHKLEFNSPLNNEKLLLSLYE